MSWEERTAEWREIEEVSSQEKEALGRRRRERERKKKEREAEPRKELATKGLECED